MIKIKITELKTKCPSHLWILSFWCTKSVNKISLIKNEQSRFLWKKKIISNLMLITETLLIQFAVRCSSCHQQKDYLVNSDNINNSIY